MQRRHRKATIGSPRAERTIGVKRTAKRAGVPSFLSGGSHLIVRLVRNHRPSSSLREQQQSHESTSQSCLLTSLFLPSTLTVTDEELRLHFSQFGALIAGNVMIDRRSNRSRGFGFVTFEDSTVAEYLLKQRHETSHPRESSSCYIEIRGMKVQIKPARSASRPEESQHRCTSRSHRRRTRRTKCLQSANQNMFQVDEAAPVVGMTPFYVPSYIPICHYCFACPMCFSALAMPVETSNNTPFATSPVLDPGALWYDPYAPQFNQQPYECMSAPCTGRIQKTLSLSSCCSDDATETVTETTADGDELNDTASSYAGEFIDSDSHDT